MLLTSKLVHHGLHGIALDDSHAEAQNEGHQQSGHNAHDGGHLNGEVASQNGFLRVGGVLHEHTGVDHVGIQQGGHNEGQSAGDDGGSQRFAGAGAQISDTGSHEANDDQGDHEVQEVAEDAVVGSTDADDDLTERTHTRGHEADHNTEYDGDDQLEQQAHLFLFFHFIRPYALIRNPPFLIFLFSLSPYIQPPALTPPAENIPFPSAYL